jgi:hypothetical protein
MNGPGRRFGGRNQKIAAALAKCDVTTLRLEARENYTAQQFFGGASDHKRLMPLAREQAGLENNLAPQAVAAAN